MPQSVFRVFDEEYREIAAVLERLLKEANAGSVYLIDRDGRLIYSCGETDGIDPVSMASLAAGNIAATGGLAKLVGEKEFSVLHEGEKESLSISVVASRAILLLVFDKRSSLGLVRLRVKRAGAELDRSIRRLLDRMESGAGHGDVLKEITDDDIDRLFN